MDLRIQKTRQNIFQAFIELREKYPLEKITVKELTERAQISKQTFYLHYRDMFDLSERIEQSMIQEMLKELPYPENILTHTGEVTKQLFQKAIDQGHNFRVVFAGSRVIIESLVYYVLERRSWFGQLFGAVCRGQDDPGILQDHDGWAFGIFGGGL